MADFNIQLQSNTNDNLFPKTKSEVVSHGTSTVSVVLDSKVNQTQVNQEARPNTIVERTGTGNINVGTGIAFNDTNTNAYLGGIGIGDGTTGNGQPFKGQPMHITGQGNAQIWTSETAPIDAASTAETIPKRDNERKINAHALVITENNDTTPKGQYSLTQNNTSSVGNGVNFPMWYDFEALQGQGQGVQIWTNRELPVERGGWTPLVKCSNGGEATYAVDGQSGTYIRIGSIVTVYGNINIVSKGNMTGEFQIQGLPFTPRGSACGVSIGMFTNLAKPSNTDTHAIIFPTNTFIRFNACTNNSATGGITWLTANHVGTHVSLVFSATFRMD